MTVEDADPNYDDLDRRLEEAGAFDLVVREMYDVHALLREHEPWDPVPPEGRRAWGRAAEAKRAWDALKAAVEGDYWPPLMEDWDEFYASLPPR